MVEEKNAATREGGPLKGPVPRNSGEVPGGSYANQPAWQEGQKGCGSLVWWLGGAGVLLAGALLFGGYLTTRQSVWMGHEGMRTRMERSLPSSLPGGELLRTRHNLRRWRDHLRACDDPYPDMGAFVTLGRELFGDGRLTVEEVRQVNEFLESRIGPSDGAVREGS